MYMETKKILIVDDEEDLLKLIDTILSRKGYDILKAVTASEAIDKAKQNMPDLILMDLLLPSMNGLDVIKILQKFPQTSDIPVIFLSGIIPENNECINIGDRRYKALSKTITSQDLLNAVSSALN